MTDRLPVEEFRAVLMGEHPRLHKFRRRLRHLPSDPRCKLCAAPFGGIGHVLRPFGFGRFAGNPALCNRCVVEFRKAGILGAEIPASMVFADIRGSTTIAEKLRPAEFHEYLDRFYRIGSGAILRHDGLVDKVVGDGVIGLFFGGVSGPRHAAKAVAAARSLVERASSDDATPVGPIPVGVGVHTGEAYVGTTGPEGTPTDFTALGDVVNTTARLAAAAEAGEVLVSRAAAEAAEVDLAGLPARTLEVRGRSETIEVLSLRVGTPTSG